MLPLDPLGVQVSLQTLGDGAPGREVRLVVRVGFDQGQRLFGLVHLQAHPVSLGQIAWLFGVKLRRANF